MKVSCIFWRHADRVYLSHAAGAQGELGSYQTDSCDAKRHTFPTHTGYSSIDVDNISSPWWDGLNLLASTFYAFLLPSREHIQGKGCGTIADKGPRHLALQR